MVDYRLAVGSLADGIVDLMLVQMLSSVHKVVDSLGFLVVPGHSDVGIHSAWRVVHFDVEMTEMHCVQVEED